MGFPQKFQKALSEKCFCLDLLKLLTLVNWCCPLLLDTGDDVFTLPCLMSPHFLLFPLPNPFLLPHLTFKSQSF